MDNEVTNSGVKMRLDSTLYSEAVVFKCFYWYSRLYDVDISRMSESIIQVTLVPLKQEDWQPALILEQVRKDLVDFKLREIVSNETKVVRELIVAKAFAYADLDQNPVSEIADPVGFDPEQIY